MDNTAAQTINLLLLDDHQMFRQGLARVLEKEPGLKVVAQCSSSAQALDALKRGGASLILLDVDLGPERALDFVTQAKKVGFEGQILVVTAGISGQEAVQLVQAGVAGILHKQHSTEALCDAIRQVAAGEVFIEQNYLSSLFRSVDQTKPQTQPRLTDRDKTVLRFIFHGLTNKDIAARLEISEGAVKASLRQLFNKLGVRTRAQLVKVALEQYREQL
ncbi:MAG TPA: response regulator transcription factor [Bryobacteraceae bacterium]|nr:response regulator transcription factor [Bryobacteraceae bacterium]